MTGPPAAQAIEFHAAEQVRLRLAGLEDGGGRVFLSATLAVDEPGDGAAAPPRTPAVVVAPLGNSAEEIVARRVESAPQRHAVRITAAHFIQAPNDRDGSRAHARLSRVLAASRRALAGWRPDGQREVLMFRGGRLLVEDGGNFAWADVYEIGAWTRHGGVVEAAPDGGDG